MVPLTIANLSESSTLTLTIIESLLSSSEMMMII
jgi:hypothetical protein